MITPRKRTHLHSNPLWEAVLKLLTQFKHDNDLSSVQVIEALSSDITPSLTAPLDLLLASLADEYVCSSKDLAKELVAVLVKRWRVSRKSLQKEVDPSNVLIPTGIFKHFVGSLESLVRYLHDVEHLRFSVIAELLQRSPSTIKTSYKKSTQKDPTFHFDKSSPTISLSSFCTSHVTPFEAAVVFLKHSGKTYKEIADLLNKDQRNVWSTYARANLKLTKLKGGEHE